MSRCTLLGHILTLSQVPFCLEPLLKRQRLDVWELPIQIKLCVLVPTSSRGDEFVYPELAWAVFPQSGDLHL